MNTKLFDLGCFSWAVLAGLVTACSQPAPTTSTAVIAPAAPPPAANPIAKISEIQNLPVFVRLLNAIQEQPAKEGMGLQVGETVRTAGKALTQIDLNNGLAFRLAGNAVLKLQPDNRLNLTAGEMITWVQPGKKVPTEIITPTAVAGIRGTTVFIQIPQDPREGVRFFAWEGSVSVRLPGETEEVLLKTAEEVRIKPGDRDIRQIRQRVRRMSRVEWQQKRRTEPLLRRFKKAKMSTLPIIDRIKPGELVVSSPTAVSEQTQKARETRQPMQERVKQKQQQADDRKDKRIKQRVEKAEKPDKPPKSVAEPAFRRPERPGKNRPSDRDNRDDRDERDRKPKPRNGSSGDD